MAYCVTLFSPETHRRFSESKRNVTAVRVRQRKAADRLNVGDFLIAYMTGVSRRIGLFEVTGQAYEDSTPLFADENDPFVVRLPIKTHVWLAPEHGIPIHDPHLWGKLSFTKNHEPTSVIWTGSVRTSLAPLETSDAKLLDKLLRVWIPVNDRGNVLREQPSVEGSLLPQLPLNYDSTTLKTIENIDVLWLKGRSMARAFEVEHTTAIYSGILRMADLLALQPNMDIRLHIVGPDDRRRKVFEEIRRPVFSLIEGKPLQERCTFLSYDSVNEISKLPHLGHVNDTILAEYEDDARSEGA